MVIQWQVCLPYMTKQGACMDLNDIKCNWKYIDGYEDYIITEHGDIYSFRPDENETRGFKGLRKMKPKGQNNPNRYLSIILCKNDEKKQFQIHRLVGKYFVPGYFDGAVIDHLDRDKHNNDCRNLEWVTQKENVRRSYAIMNQVRNFKNWIIEYPSGFKSYILKGKGEIERYIIENNLAIKLSMLTKHKKHNGYKLIEVV